MQRAATTAAIRSSGRWEIEPTLRALAGIVTGQQHAHATSGAGHDTAADGLDLLNAPVGLMAGAPLKLPLDAIEEDPDQPRQEFDPDALAELAITIK